LRRNPKASDKQIAKQAQREISRLQRSGIDHANEIGAAVIKTIDKAFANIATRGTDKGLKTRILSAIKSSQQRAIAAAQLAENKFVENIQDKNSKENEYGGSNNDDAVFVRGKKYTLTNQDNDLDGFFAGYAKSHPIHKAATALKQNQAALTNLRGQKLVATEKRRRLRAKSNRTPKEKKALTAVNTKIRKLARQNTRLKAASRALHKALNNAIAIQRQKTYVQRIGALRRKVGLSKTQFARTKTKQAERRAATVARDKEKAAQIVKAAQKTMVKKAIAPKVMRAGFAPRLKTAAAKKIDISKLKTTKAKQEALIEAGFLPADQNDGKSGRRTKNALALYKRHPQGYALPNTANWKLNKKGEDVKDLQRYLIALFGSKVGGRSGEVDGVYGPKTKAAHEELAKLA